MGCGTSNLPLVSAVSSLDTNVSSLDANFGKPLYPLPTKYSSQGLPTNSASKRRSLNTNNNALNVKEKLALSSTEKSTQNLSNFENLSLNNNINEYSQNSHQNGHKKIKKYKDSSLEESGSSCSDESSEYSSDGHLECRWIRSHFSQSILSSQTSFKKAETMEFPVKNSENQKVSLLVFLTLVFD